MSKFMILGAVLLFMLGTERPLFAQAAISEPGLYAFYHSGADVLNAGRPAFRSLEPANAFARGQGARSNVYALTPSARSRHRR
jgi:hypothetical protein